jgi:hypothetical protein
MSQAFEVTDEDLEIVLSRNGKWPLSDDEFFKIQNSLDYQQIEKAALMLDDLDEQTTSAYAEIELQLKENGFI